MITRAVEINAFVKAVNIAAAGDIDKLLTVAAHLAQVPWLKQWQFTLRAGRLVADTRSSVPVPTDTTMFVAELLTMAATTPDALDQAAAYLQAHPWHQWGYRVVDGRLVMET